MNYLEIADEAIAAVKAEKAKKGSSTANPLCKTGRAFAEKAQTQHQSITNGLPARALERLPWQLEALLRAASSDLLPKEPVVLPNGIVYDFNSYVLAVAATYLLGDHNEALRRLWSAEEQWRRLK